MGFISARLTFTLIRRALQRVSGLHCFISLSILLAVTSPGGLFLVDCGPSKNGVSATHPAWRIDLRPYGYEKREPWSDAYLGYITPHADYDSIAFADDDLLIATFLTFEGSSEQAPPRVHAVLLDVAADRVGSTGKWDTLPRSLTLLPVRDGKFVVQVRETATSEGGINFYADPRLVLYSKNLEPLNELKLPDTREDKWEDWRIDITHTRKSLVVSHHLGRELEIQWLDPQTFEPIRVWKAREGMFGLGSGRYFHVADRQIVVTQQPLGSETCKILLQTSEGTWREVLSTTSKCSSGAQFIDESLLVLPTLGEILLFSDEGQVLLSHRLRSDEIPGAVRASADSRRFAVPISKWKGGISFLDISPHASLQRIMVFDVPTRKMLFQLDSKRTNFKYLSGFALSPDGQRLAILRDWYVEVYRIPDSE